MSELSDKLQEIYNIKGELKSAIESSGKTWEDTGSKDAGKDFSTYPSKVQLISSSAKPTCQVIYTIDSGLKKGDSSLIVLEGGTAHITIECDEWYLLTASYYVMGESRVDLEIIDNKIDVIIDNVTSDIEFKASSSYYGPIPCTAVNMERTTGSIGPREVWTIRYSVEPDNTTDTVSFEVSDSSIAEVDDEGRVSWLSQGEVTLSVHCGDQTGTMTLTCTAPDIDCTFLDFTINGKSKELVCIDDQTSNLVSLQATVEPENTDCPVYWSISNKVLDGEYDDTKYYQYGTSVDGTQRVPYTSYTASTETYTTGRTTAWSYSPNSDITLNYPALSSGDDIVMYENFTSSEKEASFNFKFDGRCTVTVQCGSKTCSKTISFYTRLMGGKTISVGTFRKDLYGTAAGNSNNAVSLGVGTQQRVSLNPVLTPFTVGDIIEVENKNPGTTNKTFNYGICFWSSTYVNAGYGECKRSTYENKELLEYSVTSQIYPFYKHFDPGFEPAYKYTKYQAMEATDGTVNTWYKVWKTNDLLEDGTPDYGEGSDIISSTTAVSYCSYSNYKLNNSGKMRTDCFSMVFASGSKSTAIINNKTVNTYSDAFIHAVEDNFVIKQNGAVIFGGTKGKSGVIYNLNGCDLTNKPVEVDHGSTVVFNILCDEAAVLKKCYILMNGEDISETALDDEAKTITLQDIDGIVRIDLTYISVYGKIYGDGQDIGTIQIDGEEASLENPYIISSEDDTKMAWIRSFRN